MFDPLPRGGGGDPLLEAVLALYANGEQGAWYDPSDMSTLFQDAEATTTAGVGLPVRLVLDKSGNGNHLFLSAGTLGQDELGRYFIDSPSGETAPFNLSGTSSVSIWASFQRTGASNTQTVFNFGTTATAGSFDIGFLTGSPIVYRRGASGGFGARSSLAAGLAPVVLATRILLGGAGHAVVNPDLRVNAVQAALTNAGNANNGAGPFGNYALRVGQAAAGGAFAGRFYGLIIRGADTPDLSGGEDYMMRATAHPIVPYEFSDSFPAVINPTGFRRGSTFSRTVVKTAAESIVVGSYNTIFNSYPEFAKLGVVVNGDYHQTIDLAGRDYQRNLITLPPGPKVVEIVNGLQSQLTGSWVVSVQSDSPETLEHPAPVDRVLFYGDSITAGGNADSPPGEGYAPLTRMSVARSVAADATGHRSLFDDAVDSTARAAMVARLAAYAPTAIWLAIGTNDYGLNKWAAADFGTAYGAVLDDLHVALPAAAIYCQTPLVRVNEVANGSGSTLEDYRAAIANAVDTREEFATLVDGTSILTPADLADGLHPSTAGHAKYANAVKAVLGIV